MSRPNDPAAGELHGREVAVEDRRLVFTVERREAPGRGARWWLLGNDGAVIARLDDLGAGPRPSRNLDRYDDEELRAAWLRARDRGFRT